MELKLPTTVISKVDVARMIRELNALNDFLVGAQVRAESSHQQLALPRLSQSLEATARDNNLNLLIEDNRKELNGKLNVVLGKSPLVHISFAADPSAHAISKITQWLRTQVHPHILLQVGLQPNIAAGCMVRTPNMVLDLSLRAHLKRQEPYLIQLLGGRGEVVASE